MTKQVFIIKQDGTQEPFDARKLRNSLLRSGASQEATEEVIEQIESEVKDGMTTSTIYKHAYEHLENIERPVAARYSMKRAILALGPTGYPFENFVAEIFKAKEYENVRVDTIVHGACVEHEVDILAEKDGQKMGVEVKFHNKLGIRSDLKVALYVRARFEDIRNGGIQIDDDWLITNTKFTSNAIKYANCVGMKMVSWTYPKQGNLHDLIEETGIQPITALTTLSANEKVKLVQQKVTLCKNIENNKGILKSIGLDDKKIEDVMEESQALCSI